MRIIDAHVHLWEKQNGSVNGRPVRSLTGGRSDFGGEIRQMQPPYMLDGSNTAEMLLSNMDYACVSGAVVTQEVIDGNQNAYLLQVRARYPERFRVCAYFDDETPVETDGFDGIKLCACKMNHSDISKYSQVFETARINHMFLAVELSDGEAQTASMLDMIRSYPDVKIVIGHFGMVNRPKWEAQIRLAREKNVYVESGGITWLFHKEFYPYPSAVKVIRRAADICGMEKLMWGSDYPRTITEITYKMSYDFILRSNAFSENELSMFLADNAAAFYGFREVTDMQPIPNML